MKKLNLFAAAAAALVLGACSSDAPEAPVNGGDDANMYLSVKIKTNGTKADHATTTYDNDSKINDVTLYIYSGTTNEYLYSNTTTITVKNDKNEAIFKVPEQRFNTLKAETSMKLYVVCNATQNDKLVVDPFTNVTVTDNVPAFTAANITDNTWEDGNFLMSGYKLEEDITAPTGDEGKSQANPWKISTSVSVDRVAARVDMTYDNESTDIKNGKATEEGNLVEGVTFKIVGASILNANDNANVFLHTSATQTGAGVFEPRSVETVLDAMIGGETIFFKAPARNNVWVAKEHPFGGEAYTLLNGGHQYIHPRTNAANENAATLNDVTYVAFRVQFEFEGSAEAAAADEIVYVYKNVFIGSVDNLKTVQPKDGLTAYDCNMLHEIYFKTNGDHEALKAYQIDDLFGYAPEVIEAGKTAKAYFTYYFKPISQMALNTTNEYDARKYSVLRNNVYDLKVNSITKMGLPGTATEEEIIPTLVEYWIDVTISVNPWILVSFNDWAL